MLAAEADELMDVVLELVEASFHVMPLAAPIPDHPGDGEQLRQFRLQRGQLLPGHAVHVLDVLHVGAIFHVPPFVVDVVDEHGPAPVTMSVTSRSSSKAGGCSGQSRMVTTGFRRDWRWTWTSPAFSRADRPRYFALRSMSNRSITAVVNRTSFDRRRPT